MLTEGNQMHNFISSSGSGTIINYSSGSGSDFLTSYGYGSCSTSQKVTVPVPVPQRWFFIYQPPPPRPSFPGRTNCSRWPLPSELLADLVVDPDPRGSALIRIDPL
jgi:hypothetical protein